MLIRINYIFVSQFLALDAQSKLGFVLFLFWFSSFSLFFVF